MPIPRENPAWGWRGFDERADDGEEVIVPAQKPAPEQIEAKMFAKQPFAADTVKAEVSWPSHASLIFQMATPDFFRILRA